METTKITSFKNCELSNKTFEIKFTIDDFSKTAKLDVTEVLTIEEDGSIRGSKPSELTEAQYKEALKNAFNKMIDEMTLI